MKKFKVGDRVVGVKDHRKFSNLHGTVNSIRVPDVYDVEWDDDVGGHSIDGHCEWGHGWSVKGCVIEPEPKTYPSISIYVNSPITTAVLKKNGKVVKKAFAKCHPDDEFNFSVGVELAFNRLMWGTDYNPREVAFKGREAFKRVSIVDELEAAIDKAEGLLYLLKELGG